MRKSTGLLVLRGKNEHLNPQWHKWRAEQEPWKLMRNTGNLVGTGFYIPPEWYNHFRMFPPVQNSFLEEQTLNPHNASEQTEFGAQEKDTERESLRKEISELSKSAAVEGQRYYNMFWVEKAMDKMERSYYHHKSRGVSHQAALKMVLEEYYEEQAVKKRAHIIQTEEARLSGKFITMREASTLLTALSSFPTMNLTPQQYVDVANQSKEISMNAPVKKGRVRRVPRSILAKQQEESDAADGEEAGSSSSTPASTPADSTDSAAVLLQQPSAEDLMNMMEDELYAVETSDDSNQKLQETATGGVGKSDWFKGDSPRYTS